MKAKAKKKAKVKPLLKIKPPSIVKPLLNYHYYMEIYTFMNKHHKTMYIDKNGVLWHINDLKDILYAPQRIIAL